MALALETQRLRQRPTAKTGAWDGLSRAVLTVIGVIAVWQLVVVLTGVPPFILPGPLQVGHTLWTDGVRLVPHAAVTLGEILGGLAIASVLGTVSGLLLATSTRFRRWGLPLLVTSQALPVFALAPILVLWLGYGPASKVAMAVLIIYFPMTATLYDGLRRTDRGLLDLARLSGGSSWRTLTLIRLPSALPAFASGLRVATAVAPIGAVVGEWVGSSQGLGYMMLQANARMQVDLMFAALVLLAAMAVTLYALVDRFGRWLTPWAEESDAGTAGNGPD